MGGTACALPCVFVVQNLILESQMQARAGTRAPCRHAHEQKKIKIPSISGHPPGSNRDRLLEEVQLAALRYACSPECMYNI